MDAKNLPTNLEAEQAVLSAILLNNRVLETFSEFLKPEHFIHPAHQEIYKLAERYFSKGMPIDFVTTQNYLEQSGVLESVGGVSYLEKLIAAGVGVLDPLSYGHIVYDNFLRRELINLGQNMIQDAAVEDLDKTVNNQIEAVEQRLFELSQGDESREAKPAVDAFREALHDIQTASLSQGLSGLTTGFRDLDAVIHGLHKSDLIIVAGRPAMGKTTVALNIAFNAAYAIKNKTSNPDYRGVILFFSLEMSRSQLAQKVLSSKTEIPSDKMREGKLNEYDMKVLADSASFLNDLPLVIDETPAMSIASIRVKARRIARKYKGLSLIVVDYLQLMQSSASGRRQDNRVQEISEITRGLKMLAKDLNVPIMVVSQLSRQVEAKERLSKKPILSDLRDSGSIEQDADIVMFVYREEYYLKNRDPEDAPWTVHKLSPEKFKEALAKSRNKAELVIGKNRHGPIKDVKLNCQLEYSLFNDCDDDINLAPVPEEQPSTVKPIADEIPDNYA